MSLEDIARRRSANTGEPYEISLQAVKVLLDETVKMIAQAPQDWEKEWLATPVKDASKDAISWFRAKPESVRALLRRFPPSCIVRAKPGVSLLVPTSDGADIRLNGIVYSYSEEGVVSVRAWPDSGIVAQCNPDDLEVVGYYAGWTPERVEKMFAEGS